MAHDVFISYAVEDKEVAEKVCGALEGEGIKCWIAPRNIPYGADYEEAIVDAIAASPLLVLILSAHSNRSPYVKREIQKACVEDSPTQIIPFRIEDVPYSKTLGFYLGSTQWLDALSPPLEPRFQRLAEHVRSRLGQTPAPDNAPHEYGGDAARPAPADPAPASSIVVTHSSAGVERGRQKLWIAAGVGALLLVALVVFAVSRLSPGRDATDRNNVNAVPTPSNDNPANSNAVAGTNAANRNPNTNGNVSGASNGNRVLNANLRPGGSLINANRVLRPNVIRNANH